MGCIFLAAATSCIHYLTLLFASDLSAPPPRCTTCGNRVYSPITYTYYATAPLLLFLPHSSSTSLPPFVADLRAGLTSLHHLYLYFLLSLDQVFYPPLFLLPPCLPALPPSRRVKTPASCGLSHAFMSLCVPMPVHNHIYEIIYFLVDVLQHIIISVHHIEQRKSVMEEIDPSMRFPLQRITHCKTTLHPNIISLQSFAFQFDAPHLNSRGVEALRM